VWVSAEMNALTLHTSIAPTPYGENQPRANTSPPLRCLYTSGTNGRNHHYSPLLVAGECDDCFQVTGKSGSTLRLKLGEPTPGDGNCLFYVLADAIDVSSCGVGNDAAAVVPSTSSAGVITHSPSARQKPHVESARPGTIAPKVVVPRHTHRTGPQSHMRTYPPAPSPQSGPTPVPGQPAQSSLPLQARPRALFPCPAPGGVLVQQGPLSHKQQALVSGTTLSVPAYQQRMAHPRQNGRAALPSTTPRLEAGGYPRPAQIPMRYGPHHHNTPRRLPRPGPYQGNPYMGAGDRHWRGPPTNLNYSAPGVYGPVGRLSSQDSAWLHGSSGNGPAPLPGAGAGTAGPRS
jgi:hypothetical protein